MHVAGGNVLGGKAYMYHHFEGSKALFDYLILQLNSSFGVAKPRKIFSWGRCSSLPPAFICLEFELSSYCKQYCRKNF